MRRFLVLASLLMLVVSGCASGSKGLSQAQLQAIVGQVHQANGAALQVSAALCADPAVKGLVGANPNFALACTGVGVAQVAHAVAGQALQGAVAPVAATGGIK